MATNLALAARAAVNHAEALAEALREMDRVVANPAPEDDIATALEAARAALAAYDAARKGEG